jgi:tagatose 6-phosphate kinase
MILALGTTPTMQRSMFFDRLVPDAVNRSGRVLEYASGKSVNVARVARLLGADVTAVGFAGGDRGAALLRGLDEAGVRHDFVAVPAPTRLCTTVIDRTGGTVTELVEESSPVNAAHWAELFDRTTALLPRAAVLVLSGSLPPGGPTDFYSRCAEAAAASGCRAVLDGRGEPLRMALRVTGLTVKLNREELAATVGRPLEADADLRDAMRQTCPPGGSVLVTQGARGAVAWDGGRFWHIPAPPVKAVNPIGSGDAFAAGLAVAIERGAGPAEAYVLAAACGAANALTERAGVVDPGEVERLRGDVKVGPW